MFPRYSDDMSMISCTVVSCSGSEIQESTQENVKQAGKREI